MMNLKLKTGKDEGVERERITVICDKRLVLLQFVRSLKVGQKKLRRLGLTRHLQQLRGKICCRESESDTIKYDFLSNEDGLMS